MKVKLLLLLFVVSCSTVRHYKKVATDTDVTNKEKAIIAPWVMANFPNRELFVPGKNDTIETWVSDDESIFQLGEIIDSLLMLPKDSIVKVIKDSCRTKTVIIRRVDTFKVSNGAEVYNLQQQVAGKESEIKKLELTKSELEKDYNKIRETRNYLIGVLCLIGFVVIVFILARLKAGKWLR